MCLWIAVTMLSLRLVSAAIQWIGRIYYEHARAAAAAAMAGALPAGGVICDERADGTVLRVIIPSPAAGDSEQPSSSCVMAGEIFANTR